MRGIDRELKGRLDRCLGNPNCLDESACRDEALSVLTTIMERCRNNVELIVSRLRATGYVFKFPDEVHVFPIADIDERIRRLEEIGAFLPLSLAVWFRVVGSVCLIGSHPDWVRSGYLFKPSMDSHKPWFTDPLVVEHQLLDLVMNEWEFGRREIEIAPDACHKANVSGGASYELSLESPAVDTLLRNEPHEVNFIDYLRIAFWWGGFPGVEEIPEFPKSFISELRKDLLPI